MQVAVRGNRLNVELFAPVRGVTVTEQPQVFQHVKRPIHRRGDGAGIHVATSLDELGARDVAVGTRQDLDERPPLWRPAQAAGTQALADGRPGRRWLGTI